MNLQDELDHHLASDPPLPPSIAGHPALQALLEGPREVRRLLVQQDRLRSEPPADPGPQRTQLVRRLCAELVAHMHMQEELLYPRLRTLVDDTLPIDQSEAEHQCLRALIERLVQMDSVDPMFDARLQVLAEIFDLHQRREAREVYPLMQGRSLRNLAQAMQCRREELLLAVQAGDAPEPENEEADPVGEPPR